MVRVIAKSPRSARGSLIRSLPIDQAHEAIELLAAMCDDDQELIRNMNELAKLWRPRPAIGVGAAAESPNLKGWSPS